MWIFSRHLALEVAEISIWPRFRACVGVEVARGVFSYCNQEGEGRERLPDISKFIPDFDKSYPPFLRKIEIKDYI